MKELGEWLVQGGRIVGEKQNRRVSVISVPVKLRRMNTEDWYKSVRTAKTDIFISNAF